MNNGVLLSVLALISALTTLTVEGIKKLLDEKHIAYSANVLAVVVAFCLTLIGSILYVVYFNIAITAQVVVVIVCLIFLSFLTSTVGYDKIKQLIEQLTQKEEK